MIDEWKIPTAVFGGGGLFAWDGLYTGGGIGYNNREKQTERGRRHGGGIHRSVRKI